MFSNKYCLLVSIISTSSNGVAISRAASFPTASASLTIKAANLRASPAFGPVTFSFTATM